MNDPGIPDIASFRQAGDTAPGAEHHSRPKHQEGVLLRQVHRSPGHKGDVWWNIQERYLSSKIVIATSSKAFLIVLLLVWINWSVIFTMGFFCVMWFIDWKCCDWMGVCVFWLVEMFVYWDWLTVWAIWLNWCDWLIVCVIWFVDFLSLLLNIINTPSQRHCWKAVMKILISPNKLSLRQYPCVQCQHAQ